MMNWNHKGWHDESDSICSICYRLSRRLIKLKERRKLWETTSSGNILGLKYRIQMRANSEQIHGILRSLKPHWFIPGIQQGSQKIHNFRKILLKKNKTFRFFMITWPNSLNGRQSLAKNSARLPKPSEISTWNNVDTYGIFYRISKEIIAGSFTQAK